MGLISTVRTTGRSPASWPPSGRYCSCCVCVGVHACLPACLLACLHACLPACLRAYLRACVPTCVPACLPACLRAYLRTCVQACMHFALTLLFTQCARPPPLYLTLFYRLTFFLPPPFQGHFKVVKYLVDHVSQFPSDADLTRYVSTLSCKVQHICNISLKIFCGTMNCFL